MLKAKKILVLTVLITGAQFANWVRNKMPKYEPSVSDECKFKSSQGYYAYDSEHLSREHETHSSYKAKKEATLIHRLIISAYNTASMKMPYPWHYKFWDSLEIQTQIVRETKEFYKSIKSDDKCNIMVSAMNEITNDFARYCSWIPYQENAPRQLADVCTKHSDSLSVNLDEILVDNDLATAVFYILAVQDYLGNFDSKSNLVIEESVPFTVKFTAFKAYTERKVKAMSRILIQPIYDFVHNKRSSNTIHYPKL
jgi:hypothetical protein